MRCCLWALVALVAIAMRDVTAEDRVHELGAVHAASPTEFTRGRSGKLCSDALVAVTGICRAFGGQSKACRAGRQEHSTRCSPMVTGDLGEGAGEVLPLPGSKETLDLATEIVRTREAYRAPVLRQEAVLAAADFGRANAKAHEAEVALAALHPEPGFKHDSAVQIIDKQMATAFANAKAEHHAMKHEVDKLKSGLNGTPQPKTAWFSFEIPDASKTPKKLDSVLQTVANEFGSIVPKGHTTGITSAEKAAIAELGETTKDPALRPNMVVALKGGKHQGYCSGAGGETSCLSTRIGNLEKFHVVPAAKGFIGLKGGDKACKSGKGTVEACHEGHMNLMQKFKVFNAGPNKVALMSKESGKFCSDNGQHIECAASDITPDEKFQVKCLSGCGDEMDQAMKQATKVLSKEKVSRTEQAVKDELAKGDGGKSRSSKDDVPEEPEPTPKEATAEKLITTKPAWANSATSETLPDTGCAFDKLSNTIGADVSGNGCAKGQTVPHTKGCEFAKKGYLCTSAICQDRTWTKPKCTRSDVCFFDELVRPPGTTTNGTGCVKGGTVRNHHDCVLTKPGYLCAQGVCKDSKWVEDPLCHPIGCGFKKTNMPRVIVRGHNKNVSVPVNSKDADCQVGRITPSGRKCVFVRDGFDCEPASCSQGVWSNVMPKCIADTNTAASAEDAALQDEMKVMSRESSLTTIPKKVEGPQQQWNDGYEYATLAGVSIMPACSNKESKGMLGVFRSSAQCLMALIHQPQLDYAVYRDDGKCEACILQRNQTVYRADATVTTFQKQKAHSTNGTCYALKPTPCEGQNFRGFNGHATKPLSAVVDGLNTTVVDGLNTSVVPSKGSQLSDGTQPSNGTQSNTTYIELDNDRDLAG